MEPCVGYSRGLYGGTLVAGLSPWIKVGLVEVCERAAGNSDFEGEVGVKRVLLGKGDNPSPPGLIGVSVSGWASVETVIGSVGRSDAGFNRV